MAALLAQVYTNDLFTAYVFVEIMTLSACALIVARSKGRTLVAATRYMIMNLMGSGLFLLGLTYLYGLTGHLLMSNIQQQVAMLAETGEHARALTVTIALMSVGLAIKSALFPFHTWHARRVRPFDAHVQRRCFPAWCQQGLYLPADQDLTIASSGLERGQSDSACNERAVRVRSWWASSRARVSAIRDRTCGAWWPSASVAQIGYIYMGIGMGTEAGMVAAIFHIFVHGMAKSMLFLSTSGLIEASGWKTDFRSLRGSGFRNPIAGVAFSVGSFSMVGIPFLGGFIIEGLFRQGGHD